LRHHAPLVLTRGGQGNGLLLHPGAGCGHLRTGRIDVCHIRRNHFRHLSGLCDGACHILRGDRLLIHTSGNRGDQVIDIGHHMVNLFHFLDHAIRRVLHGCNLLTAWHTETGMVYEKAVYNSTPTRGAIFEDKEE